MCNLSDGIERQGVEKGKTGMVLEMLRAKQPREPIVHFLRCSREKMLEIGRQSGLEAAKQNDYGGRIWNPDSRSA